MTRLRVIDIHTPWFWLVVFWHGPRYGEPSGEAFLYPPHGKRWSLTGCRREPIPDTRGGVVLGENQP